MGDPQNRRLPARFMAVLLAGVLHGVMLHASVVQERTPVEVEGQPLAANVKRLLDALLPKGRCQSSVWSTNLAKAAAATG